MALSRELTRRLRIEDEPLSKRLKLAENTFTSGDLPITRKEDLVLKWLCQVAENNDENVVWHTLLRCLKFKNISGNIILKSDIKQLLLETLIAKLSCSNGSQLDDVLDCCEMVFASREIHQYFQSDLSYLSNLMKSLFALVSIVHKSVSSEGPLELETNDRLSRSYKCVVSSMECFITCYKQSINKEDFTHTFVSNILYSVCELVDNTKNDRLGAEIYKCTQQTIFGKSRYSQFKEFDSKDENNIVKRVFAELKKKAALYNEDVTLVVFVYVFRAAIAAYKADPATIDAIFRNLVDSAADARIKVLVGLRDHLTNITFDYQNKIGEKTLFEFLQSFIDEILSSNRLRSMDYQALGTIAILNPLIIETKIQLILRKILLETRETKSEIDSYRDLMIVVLNAGVRLRREQKLVPWILKAIEEITEERNDIDLQIDAVFPTDFKNQFSKSVGNMTSMQTIGVFRTLIFHLNNCIETLSKDKNIASFRLQANVDLMAAYFDGVRIFDHSIPISGQNKFVQGLEDLGQSLSILTEKILEIKRNKKMIAALLTLVWYWDNMNDWMKYYVPDAVIKKLKFPISDAHMQQLVANIDNTGCKKAMNRILLQKIGRNLQEKEFPDFSYLLDGLEKSWPVIIDQYPQIISLMNNSQISELASYLLNDARSSESVNRLSSDSIQNDERFVKSLVCETLVDIAMNVNESTTKNITKHINVIKILDRGKVSKVLKEIKKEFIENEWKSISEESIPIVEKNLQILLCLPLKYLDSYMRTLLLLVIYSIRRECEENNAIAELCSEVTLDVSDKFDIDIMDYINPDSLDHEFTRNQCIQRIIESSLRNLSSWETLHILIKKAETNDESMLIFVECIERVRPKWRNDQRNIFKKAERKIIKKLKHGIHGECKDHKDVKRLTVAIKFCASCGEFPGPLVDVTQSTLHRIFVDDELKTEKLVSEALQLVGVILKHRQTFQMNEQLVNNLWPHVLKNPIKDLTVPLIETAGPKALAKLFTLLHTETISGLDATAKDSFASSLIVWDSITTVHMGGPRHKLRIAALDNLLQILQISKIPVVLWPDVLKLVQSTLSEELHVIEKDIDVIMLLAGRSLKEAELSACEHVLAICSTLVKYHIGFITDRLPVLLALYRQLVRIVVRESRKEIDSSRDRKLRCLVLDIEKFTNSLIKLKKDLARISPYVIADLVDIFSEGVIPSHVKGTLEDVVGHFLSIADQHAIALLSRTLPTATQEIFKTLYETYNKFYKFTGKI